MNPYDFGTFHFMFQCDELTSQEFLEKKGYKKINPYQKGYKKLNHNHLGELAEIYFFIRIRLRQLSDAAKPKNDKEKKIQKEVNSTKIVNLTFTTFIKKNFNIDEKHHSKILKPIVDSIKRSGNTLRSTNDTFKKDRKTALKAVKQDCHALKYLDESLKKDKKIVLEAAKSMKRWRKIKSPMQKRNEGIFF